MTKVIDKNVAIVGASGHGKVVAETAELLGYEISIYDDAYSTRKNLEHWPVKGTVQDLIQKKDKNANVIVAIGDNVIRKNISERLKCNGLNLITLIHPTAILSKYVTIGSGTFINAGAVINSFALVGDCCIINTNSVIEHDCQIGAFSHISPNATLAGGVIVGETTWIGMGSNIKQLVQVGSNSVIGAGSLVLNDITNNVVAYGVPTISLQIKSQDKSI